MHKRSLAIGALALMLLASAAAVEAGWDEGVAAFNAKNYQEAARQFQAFVDERPDVYEGHYMLGQVLLVLKRNSDALAHLRKAYDLNSDDLGVQMALGKAYLTNGRYADAASVLGKIDASGLRAKQRVALHQMLATAFEKTGDDRRALVEKKRAADADPSDADLQYAYGAAAFNAGDLDGAIAALERAVRLDSRDAGKQKTYAQALLRKGRTSQGNAKVSAYQKASQALTTVVAADASYDNLILLAGAQLGAKQYDQALSSLERAAGKNSSDWLLQFYMGQVYTQKEQYRSAEASLKQALNKASANKDKVTVWRQLGFVYEKMKDYDDAIAAYRQAGDNAGVRRAQENQQTAQYNKQVEAEAAEIQRLQEEKKKLEEQLKNLPGSRPPVR